jgi:hypothetical protein
LLIELGVEDELIVRHESTPDKSWDPLSKVAMTYPPEEEPNDRHDSHTSENSKSTHTITCFTRGIAIDLLDTLLYLTPLHLEIDIDERRLERLRSDVILDPDILMDRI